MLLYLFVDVVVVLTPDERENVAMFVDPTNKFFEVSYLSVCIISCYCIIVLLMHC